MAFNSSGELIVYGSTPGIPVRIESSTRLNGGWTNAITGTNGFAESRAQTMIVALSNATISVASTNSVICTAGTVVRQSIEGGFYGIMGDDGNAYDPINLTPRMARHGFRVVFVARELRDSYSFHMWGQVVELLKIFEAGRFP